MRFIVTYRTADGRNVRTEVEGVSAREVRALFGLNGRIVYASLAVQPVRARTLENQGHNPPQSGLVYAHLGKVPS